MNILISARRNPRDRRTIEFCCWADSLKAANLIGPAVARRFPACTLIGEAMKRGRRRPIRYLWKRGRFRLPVLPKRGAPHLPAETLGGGIQAGATENQRRRSGRGGDTQGD